MSLLNYLKAIKIYPRCLLHFVPITSQQEQRDSTKMVIAEKDEVISGKARVIATKDLELVEKDGGLVSLQQRCSSLQTQLETVQRRNQSLEVSGCSC